jgi:hypothetical protein
MKRLKVIVFMFVANAAQIVSYPYGQPPTCC